MFIPRWSRLTAVTVAVGSLFGTTLAGCSSHDASSDAPRQAEGVATAAKEPMPDRGRAAAGDPAQQATNDLAENPTKLAENPTKVEQTERSIVYSGSITVRVDAVDDAAERAGQIVKGAQGFVSGDQRTTDARRSHATLQLRVPPADFFTVLKALADLGKEEHRSISTEDVTEQIADVDSRIATARASVDRVRSLLAQAQTIGEIVSLESELTRRESDLESLLARLNKIKGLSELSTITVSLLGPEAKTKKADEDSGFVAGLTDGWNALVASVGVLLTVVGALLPWLVALGGPALGALWLVRRVRRRASAEPRS